MSPIRIFKSSGNPDGWQETGREKGRRVGYLWSKRRVSDQANGYPGDDYRTLFTGLSGMSVYTGRIGTLDDPESRQVIGLVPLVSVSRRRSG